MTSKKKGGKRRRPPQASRQRQPQQARTPRPPQQSAGSGSVSPTTGPETGTLGGGVRPPRQAQGSKTSQQAKKKAARERSGPTRIERLAAAERARRRKAVRTRALIGGVVLVVVGALVAVVISNRRSASKTVSRLEAGSCEFDRRTDSDAGAGRNHVANPTYEVDPPAGGNHLVNPAPAGTYTAQDAPPDGQLVHSLEHGYMVLWYRPDLPAEAQTQLRQLTDKYAKDVLLVPRTSLPKSVAATAWERRLLCDDVDLAALELSITSYRNKGPEKVPHP